MRKPRNEEPRRCNNTCLLSIVVFLLFVQTLYMTLPIAGTVYVYQNNKETFNALHNLHTKEIISNVDNLKDLPIREVGRKSQRASDIVLEILHELVKGNETMIQEVRQVVHNALVPIKDVAELLNSDVRGNVQTILQKVRLILGTVHDRDIRESIRILKQAMKDFESTSQQIKKAIHHENINRTMNLVADADRTMKKVNVLVSKFVG